MNELSISGRFVREIEEIDADDVVTYGGKAAGLARMVRAGIPIPPAIVIGTDAFHAFQAEGGRVSAQMQAEIRRSLASVERKTGRRFASDTDPLMVSVRSGAAVSMPGMMDTILNLGLTATSALSLARKTGKVAFVLDSWARFWRMYAETVLDLDADDLASAVRDDVDRAGSDPSEASFAELEAAILDHLRGEGAKVSTDPHDHLIETVAAVFRSWNSPRAKAYRKHHRISDDLGTAVTIQAMVFGNADRNSGTGVAFTRDPNDGARTLYGEYLVGHQGEDLVAGTHTPIKLSDAAMPTEIADALSRHGHTLERIYRDAVDIEFTMESGTLYMLQVRAAKRTAAAAVRIAADLVDEGMIEPEEAVKRASYEQILQLLKPSFDAEKLAVAPLLAQGLGSSPGQTSGAVVLDSDTAVECAERGEDVVLFRPITSPQDIRGMLSANGIVTARGGALSHAAVVSRALDKPCIVGCEAISVDVDRRCFTIGGRVFPEGTFVSIDGADGKIYEGIVPIRAAVGQGASLRRFLDMADGLSESEIWFAPRGDAEIASAGASGADGIGLLSLTDLVMSRGTIEEFTRSISEFTQDAVPHAVSDRVRTIVREACRHLFAQAPSGPIQLRLPQLRSERARDLISDWEDIPATQFLPLGNRALNGAMLRGIAEACGDGDRDRVTIFAGGITGLVEFEAFQKDVRDAAALRAGLLVQNAILLSRLADLGGHDAPVWIDPNEIIRSAYGYPMHVMQMPSVLDEYCEQGLARANPFRKPADSIARGLRSIGGRTFAAGVVGSGGISDELLSFLHGAGYRRFSSPPGAADILRVKLARAGKA